MNMSQVVRQWFADNPGKHFMGDICESFGYKGKQAQRLSLIVCRMTALGMVVATGSRGTKRYQLGRPARKYLKLETGDARRSGTIGSSQPSDGQV